ncbi:MAG: PQQ-binding-like beta-propeller repeat protein [Verrucomicrobiae bacterium]|nr:PQQ-binding-like beta-propeller repeat protein [Verrucomicrobiae bacterium]
MIRRILLLVCLVSTATADNPDVQALINQLKTGTPQQQVAAADQLARLGRAASPAVPALLDAMTGQSPWVDVAMMDALAELRAVSLPVLLEQFQKGDLDRRSRAGRALWNIGGRAPQMRPTIEKLTKDKEEAIRELAGNILKKMDAEIAEEKAAAQQTPRKASPSSTTPAAAVPSQTSRDWPGFRGPRRDGLCAETGLLKEWPADGPKLLWQLDTLGRGHSSLAIAGGKLFTTGDRGQRQFVVALDLATRVELWATPIADAYGEYGAISTPTLDGDALYVLGTDGDLFCLQTADGQVRWRKSLTKDFDGRMMNVWKYSESPLLDGNKVICTPGGKDAMMVALDKKTGDLIWKCAIPALGERGNDGASYASAIIAECGGMRQYVQVVGRGIIGVAADTGWFLWGWNRLANNIASITSPVARGDLVFTANSYNTGSALLRPARDGEAWRVEELAVLPARTFENHHGGLVLVGDCVYGGSGLNKGDPTCIEFATGKVLWKTKAPAPGSACVLYADGHIIFRYDRGLMLLAEASPAAFRVKGRFTPPRTNSPAWAYPVIHDGKLYVRDQDLLLCYDVRAR